MIGFAAIDLRPSTFDRHKPMRTTFDNANDSRSEPLGRRRAVLLLVLVLGALTLVLLDSAGQLDGVKGRLQVLAQPSSRSLTEARITIGDAWGSVTGTGQLRQRVEQLEREVSTLRADNIRLKVFQERVGLLQQQLGINETYNWQTVAARVVQGSTASGRRIVRIDQGRVDHITPGMAVVSKEGGSPAALIGVVDKVYAQTADVLLITDYGSTISAKTVGAERPAEGIVAGQWQLGSRIKLADVNREVLLEVGHYVVTAGLSQALATDTPVAQVPPDVPIGTIISVKQTGRTQSAEIQPFVDPDRVREVWVIRGGGGE